MNPAVFKAKEQLRQAASHLLVAAESLDRQYYREAVQHAESAASIASEAIPELRNIAKYLA